LVEFLEPFTVFFKFSVIFQASFIVLLSVSY
jgi:hypothetical protein